MSAFFDNVVEASGLSKIFGKNTVKRALERAGLTPESVSPSNLRGALPELRRSIAPFLESRTDEAMARLEKLARG